MVQLIQNNNNNFQLQQSNQHYEEPGTYMEIDASPYTKDSKDGMTKGNTPFFFSIFNKIYI